MQHVNWWYWVVSVCKKFWLVGTSGLVGIFQPSINSNLTIQTHVSYFCTGASIPFKAMMHIAYSPYFRKMYKFPPILFKFPYFYLIYFFSSPYFDHDAFMHHALHVLDAHASEVYR